MSNPPLARRAPISTGIPGLDEVLGGGFTPDRLYLIEGVPGAGKTTLAMQFLLEGVARGEPVLYVTPVGNRAKNCRRSPTRTAGRSTASTSASCCRRRRPAARRAVHDVPPVRGGVERDDQAILADVEQLKPHAPGVRFAVRVAPAGRNRRCAIAGRSSRSSSSSPGRGCTVLLLDDRPRASTTCRCRASPTACVRLEQLDSGLRRRSRGACGSASIRGRTFRGGYPRLPHPDAAACACSRGWSPPSIARQQRTRRERAASPRSTPCSAAAWTRHQHARRRRGRHRQVVARHAVRAGGREPRRARGAVHLRREHQHAADAARSGMGIDLQEHVDSGRSSVQPGRSRRAARPANSRTPSAMPSRTTARGSS